MDLSFWTERLMKVPGAQGTKAHLLAQGHTEQEATFGGAIVGALGIFLGVILFNSFIYGIIRGFFDQAWAYCLENPVEATLAGIFATLLFLAVLFKWMGHSSQKKIESAQQTRRDRHRMEEKRDYLRKGAMGNFEEIFRYFLKETRPDLEVKTCHVVDNIPRILFLARRFNTELGGDVGKNYNLFRDALFQDTLDLLGAAFDLAENIPAVIVDAQMNFISGKAKYYEGSVLSVKAQRDVFLHARGKKTAPFKALTSFDLRYNDGMEVKSIPQEESKQARVLERIKENAPRLNVRYEAPKAKADDGWEKPKEIAEPEVIQETTRGKEMSALSLSQFQDLVLGVLAKMSFAVQKVKKVPGGTLQIQVDFAHPVVGGSFLVLARQYPETAPVHADLIRELDEVTREEACKRGIYIVTGRYTEEARNITRKMAVDLVDGARLEELVAGPPYDGRWTFRIVDEKGVVQDLSRMPLLSFEKETDLFLKSMGFRVEKIRRQPGGSVVAVAQYPHPVVGGKFCVMAKQFQASETVSPEFVSEMSHVMKAEFCDRGLLMVTTAIGQEARALARFSNVDLVDRNTWENLRRQI
ncbi:MAG TPA: restriction endonuclease [bacterium]|nr:restriction endonuclease [bacterium]